MVGSQTYPPWLAADALFQLFAANRKQAMSEYVQFVGGGGDVTIGNNSAPQVSLGDDDFVGKYQSLQNERVADF